MGPLYLSHSGSGFLNRRAGMAAANSLCSTSSVSVVEVCTLLLRYLMIPSL